jgi:tripartite-type tricarboxylate transporter receptor subunit TctC
MSRQRHIARMLALLGAASAWVLWSHSGRAQTDAYPARPVRVIVGLAPGGATDIQARLFAQKLTESTGRPFVVENRAGAGGTIAYAQVAKSPPDGYTLVAAASGFSSTPLFYPKLAYDPFKDFAPVSLLVQAPFLLLVHPSVPAKSVRELIALTQARPGMVDFGSAGHGTSTGMALDLFRIMARAKITHVPYKGIGQALVDTLAGQVHGYFGNPLSSLVYAKAGRLRALAVTSATRSRVLPELPTVAESGVPGYEAATWHGWLAPGATPATVIGRLNTELAKATRAPDLAEKLSADGAEPVGTTPEQFARHLVVEADRWRKVVGETGMTAR